MRLFVLATALCLTAPAAGSDPHAEIRGMTVSTPTYGREWGTDAMATTLDTLRAHGVNWISVHPYAGVSTAGAVTSRLDPADPPPWLVRPIEEAHARDMKILVKPHLAYWGSGFAWRGDIAFHDPEARARFFREYTAWIVAVARACHDADALAVGTELDGTIVHEAEWRALIAAVREVFPGHLTYAANWDRYEAVPFWDALDAIGIQAYFPLLSDDDPGTGMPSEPLLRARWRTVLDRMDAISARTGKPVVFTELGYDTSADALRRPWASGRGGEALQELALRVALTEIGAHDTVRGVFLWKWFPGEAQVGDFRMSRPGVRAVLAEVWGHHRPATPAGTVPP